MVQVKKSSAKILSIIAIAIFILGIVIYLYTSNDSFESSFNKLNQSDYQNFKEIGDQLFLLYDKGYISKGEIVSIRDNIEKSEVESILNKYKHLVADIYFVDENVILITFGALFQQMDGISLRRNNAELKDTYECTGFDEGTFSYDELMPDVYYFTAGL